MKDLNDLLKRYAKGDAAVFEQIFRETYGMVYAIAFNYLRDKMSTEDAAQDTYTKIMQSVHMFNPVLGNAKAWIAKIARNSALDILRKKKEERPIFEDDIVTEGYADDEIFNIFSKDENLALQLKMRRYKYSEISAMTGWDYFKIANLIKSAKKKLIKHMENSKVTIDR
ncbi:MAG: sigma-70 family RNA polymerase sigma factor [Firmicutes bacterium]|nr:sigma-70 family RNA polymerase sigma factor [Bacillota bacterium]